MGAEQSNNNINRVNSQLNIINSNNVNWGEGHWPNGENVTNELRTITKIDGGGNPTSSSTFLNRAYDGFCEIDNNIIGSLPNIENGNQILYKPRPYGPASCRNYAVVRKPKIHPGII